MKQFTMMPVDHLDITGSRFLERSIAVEFQICFVELHHITEDSSSADMPRTLQFPPKTALVDKPHEEEECIFLRFQICL